MKSFEQLRQETNALHVDFLRTDLSAAYTFLDVAKTTQDRATRARNVNNATVAHDAVLRFLPRVLMSEQMNTEFLAKLDLLRGRIQAFDLVSGVDDQAVKLTLIAAPKPV